MQFNQYSATLLSVIKAVLSWLRSRKQASFAKSLLQSLAYEP